MLASTDSEFGDVGPDKLADLTIKSEQTLLLTAMAVDAAARTRRSRSAASWRQVSSRRTKQGSTKNSRRFPQ